MPQDRRSARRPKPYVLLLRLDVAGKNMAFKTARSSNKSPMVVKTAYLYATVSGLNGELW